MAKTKLTASQTGALRSLYRRGGSGVVDRSVAKSLATKGLVCDVYPYQHGEPGSRVSMRGVVLTRRGEELAAADAFARALSLHFRS